MKKSDKIIKFIIILIIVLFIVILFLISGSFHNYVVSKAKEDKDDDKFNIQENETIIDNSNSIMNEIENNHTLNTNETQEHNKTNPNNEIPNNEIPNNEILNNETKNNETIEGPSNNAVREFGSNVAFIGDSRTQAFLMYTGLNEVVDYTNIGLMVNTAISKKFITGNNGEKITILDDLKNRNVDTVYIMLGVNELGWVYSSIFIQKYEELIDRILEIKPECEIIVQSIIPVTKSKSDNDSIYNNKKIDEYNGLIREMTARKNINFINLVPALTDESGNLPEDASTDGIHLDKEYCLKWLEVLKNS